MSARPTPETDEQEKMDNGDTAPLLAFARSLERERDEARELARELRDALTAISTNPHLSLDDKVYDVRDREGEGWSGPSVIAWANACRAVDVALTKVRKVLP